jgi:ribonuclease HI
METQQPSTLMIQEHWSMYFDHSFTHNGVGGCIIRIFPMGDQLIYEIRLHFCATNNTAEYEALVNIVRIATEHEVQ